MNYDSFEFMAWHKELKKLCYVECIFYGWCEPEIYPNGVSIDIRPIGGGEDDIMHCAFSDIELLKCTGRKDSTGELIFENFIVENPKIHGKRWVIQYRDDSEFVGFVPRELGIEDHIISHFTNWSDLKIIGNIYENSELLNEKPND